LYWTSRSRDSASAALPLLLMGEVQGQGYIGQALDIADVLAVAYFHAMRYRPDDPHWEERDRFLLSNGHYAIALYATLTEAGIVPEEELETYGSDDSRLPMSGMASYTPGMEMSGGSLGLGLSIAVGMGLGLKRKGSPSRVLHPVFRWRAGRRLRLGSHHVGSTLEAR
jgi:transketolase